MSLDRREVMKLAAMSAATGLANSFAQRGAAAPLPPVPVKPEVPGVTLGQGAVPVLRHRLPRAGRREGRPRRGDRRRPAGRRQQGPALRQGLPRRRDPLRRGPPDAAAAPPRRRAGADRLGRGDRHRRPPHHGDPAGFALLRQRPVDDPRGLRRPEIHEGRPRQQPHRPQRPALHGVGGDRLPRHLRRRRAGRLLRRPRRRATC